MEKVLDRDSSTIIGSGTIEKPGYVTRVTEEVLSEVNRHGQYAQSGSFRVDSKVPDWADFTSLDGNSDQSIYIYGNEFVNFTVLRLDPQNSSYTSLCGNPNHRATVVFFPGLGGVYYGICESVAKAAGDFSMVRSYLFNPEDHLNFDVRDRCLGRILKNIVRMRQ